MNLGKQAPWGWLGKIHRLAAICPLGLECKAVLKGVGVRAFLFHYVIVLCVCVYSQLSFPAGFNDIGEGLKLN